MSPENNIVEDIPGPPENKMPLLTLKPGVENGQIRVVAAVEAAFDAWNTIPKVVGISWFLLTVAFFVADLPAGQRHLFIVAPMAGCIGAGLLWWVIAILIGGAAKYKTYLGYAARMDYRFYDDCYVYMPGNDEWHRVSFEHIEGVRVKPYKPPGTGHIQLIYKAGDDSVPFGARQIPNIAHADSMRNDIERLLKQYQSRNAAAG